VAAGAGTGRIAVPDAAGVGCGLGGVVVVTVVGVVGHIDGDGAVGEVCIRGAMISLKPQLVDWGVWLVEVLQVSRDYVWSAYQHLKR